MTWFLLCAPPTAVSAKANSLAATAPFRRISVHLGRHAARGHELTKPLPVQKQFPGWNLEHGRKFVDGRGRQGPLTALPAAHVILTDAEQRGQLDLGQPSPFTQFTNPILHLPISLAGPAFVIVQRAYSIHRF